jgi:hypothetical protein
VTVCLIDDNMTTALIAEPIRQSWVEPSIEFELEPGLDAETVGQRGGCALVGSVDACLLADRFTVITDVALASWHAGAVALWTPVRPDEIDNVPVVLNGVSRTAEAIARATIARFFGITITGWERGESNGDAVVREHEGAFFEEVEPATLNDLVRSWFVLSGLPVATHLLIAPRALLEEDPNEVASVVEALKSAGSVGVSRRREIRRNMHTQFPGDRDQLVMFHNEQTLTLTKTVRKGWLDLIRRVGRAMNLPLPETVSFHTFGAADESGQPDVADS